MNTFRAIQPGEVRHPLSIGGGISTLACPDKAFAVETLTEDGRPYTWARIFRSKHGRTNMGRVGEGGFLAGSKSHRDIIKYAKTLSPDTTAKVFIVAGRIRGI